MRARFIGEVDGDSECVAFGLTFPQGGWVSIGKDQARLASNPMFEFDQDGDGEADPSKEELRAALDARGIKYAANAGVAKLSALLAEAEAQS